MNEFKNLDFTEHIISEEDRALQLFRENKLDYISRLYSMIADGNLVYCTDEADMNPIDINGEYVENFISDNAIFYYVFTNYITTHSDLLPDKLYDYSGQEINLMFTEDYALAKINGMPYLIEDIYDSGDNMIMLVRLSDDYEYDFNRLEDTY